MYTPDRIIVQRLKAYDRHLSVSWDKWRERWVLYWRDKEVHVVENMDGSFRPLDDRVVAHVAVIDSHRYGPRERMKTLWNHNNRIEAGRRRDRSNFNQAVARDELYRAQFGGPMIQGWRAGQ